MAKDLYEVLGVSREATEDEIKKAFRRRARELHPDVNKAPDAEDQFKELVLWLLKKFSENYKIYLLF